MRSLRRTATFAIAVLFAAIAVSPESLSAANALALINAEARAAGNRRGDAVALGTALLSTPWRAQVLKVRIDGIGDHDVAGLVLSGVKFHGALDSAGFTDEVVALVKRVFARSRVEEVDVWATVPLHVGEHVVVAGDNAQPTTRTVYGVTVRRDESATFPARLRAGTGVYWDAAWKQSLAKR